MQEVVEVAVRPRKLLARFGSRYVDTCKSGWLGNPAGASPATPGGGNAAKDESRPHDDDRVVFVISSLYDTAMTNLIKDIQTVGRGGKSPEVYVVIPVPSQG